MKLKNIFSGLAATLMALCLIGCDEEKDRHYQSKYVKGAASGPDKHRPP